MSSASSRPFVSVKFSPVGRTYSFLLPEFALDAPPPAGNGDSHLFAIEPENTDSADPSAAAPPQKRWLSPFSDQCQPPFEAGEKVVVETAEGHAVGTITHTLPALVARKTPTADSPSVVVRRATRDDVLTRLRHEQREQEAQRICLLKIRERGLAMKLAKVEQLFDGSRLIFYYTAEGRVDFRELVRDLAAHFRTRIEMRQIGVRDEARLLGGYGSCGRPLCCTTWLQAFEPISIKMAKQQHLSLNPSKLSGMCGRLKCCLRYELPNGKGVKHAGCADEGGCGSCSNPTGPGTTGGSCASGGCGSCG
jgi:cell fate regulator YaaT (PSP1 superfamily)